MYDYQLWTLPWTKRHSVMREEWGRPNVDWAVKEHFSETKGIARSLSGKGGKMISTCPAKLLRVESWSSWPPTRLFREWRCHYDGHSQLSREGLWLVQICGISLTLCTGESPVQTWKWPLPSLGNSGMPSSFATSQRVASQLCWPIGPTVCGEPCIIVPWLVLHVLISTGQKVGAENVWPGLSTVIFTLHLEFTC